MSLMIFGVIPIVGRNKNLAHVDGTGSLSFSRKGGDTRSVFVLPIMQTSPLPSPPSPPKEKNLSPIPFQSENLDLPLRCPIPKIRIFLLLVERLSARVINPPNKSIPPKTKYRRPESPEKEVDGHFQFIRAPSVFMFCSCRS